MSSYIFEGNTSQYRVTLHDTYKRDSYGHSIVRYSLRRLSDGAIIFKGKDLGVPQGEKPAGKESAISLLVFLTTPDDNNTPSQMEWCESFDAEALSGVVCEYEVKR